MKSFTTALIILISTLALNTTARILSGTAVITKTNQETTDNKIVLDDKKDHSHHASHPSHTSSHSSHNQKVVDEKIVAEIKKEEHSHHASHPSHTSSHSSHNGNKKIVAEIKKEEHSHHASHPSHTSSHSSHNGNNKSANQITETVVNNDNQVLDTDEDASAIKNNKGDESRESAKAMTIFTGFVVAAIAL